MELELIIQEVENGFHFTDSEVDIKILAEGNGYKLHWKNLKENAYETRDFPNITKQQAYGEFLGYIQDYWSSALGPGWMIANMEEIKKKFEPLEKYR